MTPPEGKPSSPHAGPIIVTAALPYANHDIHLGHIVEAVQTDVYVRFQRLCGATVRFMWADDTHGTPIELAARKRGITPGELVGEAWNNHVRDYRRYSIDYDIFYTTNSEENRLYAERIFASLQHKGLVAERDIEQYYCEHDQRFLPDRFIKGTCPKCGAVDQYGDVCESCGTTYAPTELTEARCAICSQPPQMRTTRHFFVQLGRCEEFLRGYLQKTDVLQTEMNNFVMHWIDEGLKDWCISRDGPYFGFRIPGTDDKYFYVWLDAPIGYLSATAKWCADHGEKVEAYWGADAPGRIVHFIGKDIVYFHTLFWPVMLWAADFKLPSRIFVHGFLTMNGEKMSKSRGTFVLAKDFAEKVDHPLACEYLRFFFAAKLADNTSDIDLNIDEFCTRVNTTLANNIGNLHNRTFTFLHRFFNGRVPDADWDADLAAEVAATGTRIREAFERVDYKAALELIHVLGNRGNKYFQDSKPWELIKTDQAAAQRVMVSCVNLVKALAVFLKPVVPNLVSRIEEQLQITLGWPDHCFSLRTKAVGVLEKLVQPIEKAHFETLLPPAAGAPAAAPVVPGPEEGLISIEDFGRVDLRVGQVSAAQRVDNSDKLLLLQVQSGTVQRQIVAGLGKHYTPEELVGRQVVFVANLKPAMLMGLESQGMVLAAKKGKKLVVIGPAGPIDHGARVA